MKRQKSSVSKYRAAPLNLVSPNRDLFS